MAPRTEALVSAILNAAWPVRNARGKRSIQRAQAIQKLGLTVRMALEESDDFEPLLGAILNGLSSRDDTQF